MKGDKQTGTQKDRYTLTDTQTNGQAQADIQTDSKAISQAFFNFLRLVKSKSKSIPVTGRGGL
jgi:hypothetical protein